MEVRDLEGRTWTVHRRWLPGYAATARARWSRTRIGNRASHALDVDAFDFDLAGILVGIAVIAVLAITFVAVPLLVDAAIVALAVVLGAVVRTVFRRPWTVEASSGDLRYTRQVIGWRAAGRAAATWADELRHGRGVLPPAEPG